MMIKEINTNKLFRDLEEVKGFYNLDAYDLEEIEESLKDAEFEVIEKFEVECWWKGKNFNNGYYDTIEEAKEVFEKILEEMEEIKEDFKETTDKEKFIKELEENDEPVDFIQINKFDEFENVEVLIGKEIKWK